MKYLWNIDVLCEDVPYMIYNSYLEEYDEGTAYNFVQYGVFDKKKVLQSYRLEGDVSEMKPQDDQFDLMR